MKRPLARGDVIKWEWCDATEDPVGNAATAIPCTRISYGLFYAQEVRGVLECLVTTTTIDTDSGSQSGYCVMPMGMVLKIEIIRRVKK